MVRSSSVDVTRSLRGCFRGQKNETKLKYGENLISGVTSAEELGTMSKNNLRGITLG